MDRQTLLLIEDEAVLRTLAAEFLRGLGFAVVEAVDGRDAVDRLDHAGPFHLLIVDLNLPHLSGVEVCRAVRRRDPGQPILICSAAIMPDDEATLRGLGVAHFLTKPYHPANLMAMIRAATRSPAVAPIIGNAEEMTLSCQSS